MQIGIMIKREFVMKLQGNVVPEVTGKTERQPVESGNMKAERMRYELADNLPTTIKMSRLSVLIEND